METNVMELFFSYTGVTLIGTILTGWVTTKIIPAATSSLKKIISIVVLAAVCAVGIIKGVGVFAEANMLYNVLQAIGIIGMTQGLYDIGALNSVLKMFFAHKSSN